MTDALRKTIRTYLQGAAALAAVVVPLLTVVGVDAVTVGEVGGIVVAATGFVTWAQNALEGRGSIPVLLPGKIPAPVQMVASDVLAHAVATVAPAVTVPMSTPGDTVTTAAGQD